MSAAQGERVRITSASNVRLRVEPSVEVRLVAALPLGTDLVEIGTTSDGRWAHVRTTSGQEGWVAVELTRTVPAGERLRAIEAVIDARVSRQGDGFAAWLELIGFIDRVRHETPDAEAAGRFALYRLRAIRGAAQAGSWAYRRLYRPEAEPLATWVKDHAELLVYNEPGGQWMLRQDAIMAEHDRHRATRAADDIAWLAAENGWPGECEGDPACYLERTDRSYGEYLRLYPKGRYVASVLDRLLRSAAFWRSRVHDPREFTTARDCSRLMGPLIALRAAIAAAYVFPGNTVMRDQALRELDEIGRVCG